MKPKLPCFQMESMKKIYLSFHQNASIFIQENANGNIFIKMLVILLKLNMLTPLVL